MARANASITASFQAVKKKRKHFFLLVCISIISKPNFPHGCSMYSYNSIKYIVATLAKLLLNLSAFFVYAIMPVTLLVQYENAFFPVFSCQ